MKQKTPMACKSIHLQALAYVKSESLSIGNFGAFAETDFFVI